MKQKTHTPRGASLARIEELSHLGTPDWLKHTKGQDFSGLLRACSRFEYTESGYAARLRSKAARLRMRAAGIEIESGQIEDESGELHDISELLDNAAERLDQAHQEWLEARKHAVRHQDRDEALQIVIDAARDLADLIESEDEEPEDVAKIRAAINATEAAQAETQEPSPPFYACPDCGCTDIETSAWVSVNTNKPTNDEGPTDEVYCPQCDSEDKQYALGKHKHLVEVDALQPFIKGW